MTGPRSSSSPTARMRSSTLPPARRPTKPRSTRLMSRARWRCSPPRRPRRPALRVRLFARCARTRIVHVRRLEGAGGSARAAIGPGLVVVRPPAVYGPGDRETGPVQMAKLGVMLCRRRPPLGPPLRRSARFLLALVAPGAPSGLTVEPDDGRRGGWTHKSFAARPAKRSGSALWSSPRPPPCSASPRGPIACCDGAKAKLTPDRAAYFRAPRLAGRSFESAPAASGRRKSRPSRASPRRRLVSPRRLALARHYSPKSITSWLSGNWSRFSPLSRG